MTGEFFFPFCTYEYGQNLLVTKYYQTNVYNSLNLRPSQPCKLTLACFQYFYLVLQVCHTIFQYFWPLFQPISLLSQYGFKFFHHNEQQQTGRKSNLQMNGHFCNMKRQTNKLNAHYYIQQVKRRFLLDHRWSSMIIYDLWVSFTCCFLKPYNSLWAKKGLHFRLLTYIYMSCGSFKSWCQRS